MTKIDHGKFSPNTILRINNLFESLSWKVDEKGPVQSSTFNRFCDMIRFLDLEQQELIFELTKRFLRIEMTDYMRLLLDVVAKIDSEKLKGDIILGPLVAPDDYKEIKSSVALMYYCRTFDIQYNSKFLGKNIILHLLPGNLLEDLKGRENKNVSIILIDDYIGTGETAINATSFIVDETGVSRDDILVLSIACQELGSNALTSRGIANISYHMLKRGISDFYDTALAAKYLDIMRGIEKGLKVSRTLKLGYGGSEALIKLSRTPNNTFPIFWLESKKQNRFAPFPRD